MGKRQRRRQREQNMRKRPNESQMSFCERFTAWLFSLDIDPERLRVPE